ncbi:aldehyde dehydrogenase, partial [bacterium]|nr:aldehyde dehydrogenase [bacterium]
MPTERSGIEAIVERVLGEVAAAERVAQAPPAFDGRGILPDMDSAVAAACSAHREFGGISLELRRDCVAAMRETALEHAEELAVAAVDETGLGRIEDKIRKNQLAARATPGVEDLKPQVYSGDHGLTLVERAPFGVIGSITPSTNSSETIINNAIGMVAAGNTVVFNPHPGARIVSLTTIDLLNRAIARAGGPRALLFAPVAPSIPSAQELMRHPDVRLLVVTGGPAVVRAAMESGKKVIAAGPGNPPVVVDATADLEKAARDIIAGATLDNNIVCIAEKEIIVEQAVAALLKRALASAGAVEVKGQAVARLMDTIIAEDHGPGRPATMNRDFIGKDLAVILDAAGYSCPAGARLAFFDADPDHPLV